MGQCVLCQGCSEHVSCCLGLCLRCILSGTPAARAQAVAAHRHLRRRWGLPASPPRTAEGRWCSQCVNGCRIGAGEVGYCGVRRNDRGRLVGGDRQSAAVQWYHDPLPTNCVANWVCPASGPAGYPAFTDTEGPETDYFNLAVFYEACSFDCLFCQNWHFREHSLKGPRHGDAELAAAVNERTRCICFFGGDPTCQAKHALSAARIALANRQGRILRICWETNGSMSKEILAEMVELSLESGGCVKFDLKAWDDSLHRALCRVSNRRTLENLQHVAHRASARPDPPLLVASTLLVPGYVESEQVGKIASLIAKLGPGIPYALLAFHPAFEMKDLPVTSRRQAEACLAVAKAAGLRRVRLGNVRLLA